MSKRSVMKVSKSSAEAFGDGAKATSVSSRHRKEAMAGLKFLTAPKAQPVAKSTPSSMMLVQSSCVKAYIPENSWYSTCSVFP